MSACVRRATLADVPGLVAVKQALRLREDTAAEGGFLLGTDAAGYAALVAAAWVFVAEGDGAVVGFSTSMPDALVRGSELWTRRAAIRWEPGVDVGAIEASRVAYVDQLAVLPAWRRRRVTGELAAVTLDAVTIGHDLVFATTVREPVTNRAAWPMIARAGGRRVGTLDEVYDGYGRIVSDLHVLDADIARGRLAAFWSRTNRHRGPITGA